MPYLNTCTTTGLSYTPFLVATLFVAHLMPHSVSSVLLSWRSARSRVIQHSKITEKLSPALNNSAELGKCLEVPHALRQGTGMWALLDSPVPKSLATCCFTSASSWLDGLSSAIVSCGCFSILFQRTKKRLLKLAFLRLQHYRSMMGRFPLASERVCLQASPKSGIGSVPLTRKNMRIER